MVTHRLILAVALFAKLCIAQSQVYPYFPPPGVTYSATAGDSGGPLLNVGDTFQLNSPATPSLNPAFDLSAANGLSLCADSNSPFANECVYYMAPAAPFSGAIVYKCITNSGDGCFILNDNGDALFQQSEAGADVSWHDINVSTAANSFGTYLVGYSNGDRCGFASQNPTSATHPPQGGGTNLTSATLPNGGGYLGCFGASTFSFYTGGKETFRQDAANNFKFTGGKTSTSTSDTAGFAYLESVAGVPSGTPATTYTGAQPCRWDSSDGRWYCYNGSNWINSADNPTTPILKGSTGSIGGGALTAGACTSGTATVAGATTSMAIATAPAAYPGDGAWWEAYVSGTNTVTVKVCVAVAATPAATTYTVRVLQ